MNILLGLGSNWQQERHLRAGLEALAEQLTDMRCSPVFRSQAVGISSPDFYNLVVAGSTGMPLEVLDRWLKGIEEVNGRGREAGLPLDIDILTYGEQVGVFRHLVLPRPDILTRAFVLWPLALLVPEQCHPVSGERFDHLWARAGLAQCLWPVAFSWRGQALTDPLLLEAHSVVN